MPRHAAHHVEFLARLEALAKAGESDRDGAIEANFAALDTLFRDALNGDSEFANWFNSR